MKLPSYLVTLVLFKLSTLCLTITSLPTTIETFLTCLPEHSNFSIYEAIYTPEKATFEHVLLAYLRNAIITAMHASHVQATVICANLHGLQNRIRSGGHDYEGLSYVSHLPFVVLDMFNLRAIHVDVTNESAWVDSGAILGEVYYEIAKKTNVHGFPAGSDPTVGVGGHFSAGGYGVMLQKYGLVVDNIVDAKLVNVNGTILDRDSMGEDLFWAIRGGGTYGELRGHFVMEDKAASHAGQCDNVQRRDDSGARRYRCPPPVSFWVILSWKIRLLPMPANVTMFNVTMTVEQGVTDVLHRWQILAPRLPKEVFIIIQC